jgi:predicted DNA-binding protein (MmcQ/YjbR family)
VGLYKRFIKVYRSESTTLENMKDWIRDAYQQINTATFESVELSFRDRIN